jgi:hypothetical protein
MRTCFLFCFLLAVTAAALGGQQSHPEIQWAERYLMHVRGDVRPSPSGISSKANMPDAYHRGRQSPPWRLETPSVAPSCPRPLTSTGAPGNLSINPKVGPSAQGSTREFLLKDAEPATGGSVCTNHLAPFDTIHEAGQYGDRIHVFSYERGHLIQKLTKHRVVDAWELQEGYACSYTSSGLLAQRSGFLDQISRPCWIESWQYDATGRVISYRYDFFGCFTDIPQCSWQYTWAYNVQGERINFRYEAWRGVDQFGGSEECVTFADTSRVTTSAVWQKGDWVNAWREIVSGSPGDGHQIDRWQKWDDIGWVDDGISITTYDEKARPVRWSAYGWQNNAWAESYHMTYSYGASSCVAEVEGWDGLAWRPLDQYRTTTDAMGRTLVSEWLAWDGGWVLFDKCIYEYGIDGSDFWSDSSWYRGELEFTGTCRTEASGAQRSSGSYWGDGRLVQCYAYWTDASGHRLLDMNRHWSEANGAWEGSCYSATYTPGGHESDVVTMYEGLPYADTRYLFTYDDAERVRSVKVFVRSGDHWIDSTHPGSANYGSSWSFDPDDPAMSFYDFDELIFSYRLGVSGVASTTDEKPEHSLLEQNYPNPFNPETRIGFGVSCLGSRVRLVVYDVLGREIAVLVEGMKESGEYTVTFDGAGLSTGVYIYRLTLDGRSECRKMLLMH